MPNPPIAYQKATQGNKMLSKFLTASSIVKKLQKLIEEHEEFHWAVAWGSFTGATDLLLRYPEKFRDVTFGVDFSQTHPDLIDALQRFKIARVATKFSGGTYHPKVFAFRTDNRASTIIGSANFTNGGLYRNWEAAVYVEGKVSEPFFSDLFNFTKESAKLGEPITSEFALAYRSSFKRASRMPKPPRDPLYGLRQIKPDGFSSPLVSMTWEEYARDVGGSALHDVTESLKLLRIAQGWFASAESFADFTDAKRKAIAGVIGEKQKTTDELRRDWGWFGSMKGMGDFANRIDQNDNNLAQALDSIPQKGEVKKEHFQYFVQHFRAAFQHSSRIGSYPTASRLLAMKRPDTFVCICRPNIIAAASRMAFSRTTLTLDDYWDKIIEVIRLSDWYNSEKPKGPDGIIWENRVAMLDAIFYRPE